MLGCSPDSDGGIVLQCWLGGNVSPVFGIADDGKASGDGGRGCVAEDEVRLGGEGGGPVVGEEFGVRVAIAEVLLEGKREDREGWV